VHSVNEVQLEQPNGHDVHVLPRRKSGTMQPVHAPLRQAVQLLGHEIQVLFPSIRKPAVQLRQMFPAHIAQPFGQAVSVPHKEPDTTYPGKQEVQNVEFVQVAQPIGQL
jgi:hypothetical protein